MGFPLSTPTGSTGSTPTSSSTKEQTGQNKAVDMSFTIEERGKPNTLDYRVFFRNTEGKYVSPFHDIPIYADEAQNIFHDVVELTLTISSNRTSSMMLLS
eukprot:XP_014041556.1 PREDICTED: inorganic pyrophosphatase-like [Salmo salar]